MGTTTSYQPQTTDDVNAIIQGMSRSPVDTSKAPIPAPLQPGYQPIMPTALQPPASSFGPGAFTPQTSGQWPASSYPNAPPPPPPRTADPAGLTPSPYTNQPGVPATQPPPGTPGIQVATNRPAVPLTDPRNRQPDEYHLGQPIWHPRPGEQGYQPDTRRLDPQAQQQNFIQTYGPLAEQVGQQLGVDPRLILGQWALESDWGSPRGAAAGGNMAGIKNPDGSYAIYRTPQDFANAYVQFLQNPRYQGAIGAGQNGDQFFGALKRGGYFGADLGAYKQGVAQRVSAFGNQIQPQQQPVPPEPRGYQDWGKDLPLTAAPPRDFGPGPSGQPQGPFGQASGMAPGQSGFTRVLNAIGPLLLGIGSLALRLPLSTAITAYGAMARAQDNGQREAYQRARTQFQDQLKEANAQQTLESQAASDAFSEYANNPQGLQQRLAQIALQYNDPTMFRMAERGDLNGIHQMQQKRDQYNQDLTKLNRAAQDEQDRQAQNAAVTAMDRQWHDDFVAKNGREPTADEIAIEHNKNIGEAARAGTKDPKAAGAGEEARPYNVLDKDGNPTGRQVRVGKNGGLFNLDGTPTTINEAAGEHLDTGGGRTGSGKQDTGDFTWTNPDGSPGKGYATYTPGKGLVDAQGNVIPQKAGTYPSKISSQSMGSQAGGTSTPGKIEDWEGMKEGDPPPNAGITPEAWTAAQQWAREGQAPKGLSSRAGGIYQQAWHALPYALHALGRTGADMPQDAINYETRRVAATAAERYFASGQGARQMISLNTVAAHIDLFRQYARAMRNSDEPAMNRLANELAYQTGSPELTNMGIASIVTGDEVIRLLTTTGGARGDRQDIHDQLNANSGPDQLEGAADALTNFVRERYEPLHLQYTNRLGADDQTRKMYETEWQQKMTEPAKLMVKEGQRPIQGGEVPTMTQQQYDAAPSGTRYKMPGSDKIMVKP